MEITGITRTLEGRYPYAVRAPNYLSTGTGIYLFLFILVTQKAATLMKDNKINGSIVNIASVVGKLTTYALSLPDPFFRIRIFSAELDYWVVQQKD